jgi:NAD(P)-dependent dehydrogenase (short-subunit alcohol dehydrogenase family)
MVQAVIGAFGRLDVAFNNAGSGGAGGWLHEIAERDWDLTVDGYLRSVYLCMKYEIEAMLQSDAVLQGGAECAIVNNSSVDGQRAFPVDPAYSAAKHGVLGLTKSAGVQYASRGIRINAVCPGWIRTPPIEAALAEQPELEAQWLMHQPVARLGTAEEVAQAVLWLCSPQASLVTATALAVDGGYLAV